MRGTAPSGYANDTMKQQASTGFEREACQDDAPGTVPGARGQDDRVAGDGGDDQGSAVRFHGDTLPHLLHRKETLLGADEEPSPTRGDVALTNLYLFRRLRAQPGACCWRAEHESAPSRIQRTGARNRVTRYARAAARRAAPCHEGFFRPLSMAISVWKPDNFVISPEWLNSAAFRVQRTT